MTVTINGTTGVSLCDTNSVPTAALQASAVTQPKVGSGVAGNGPAFSAYPTANISTTNGVWVNVVCDTKLFDTASCYNTSTGRFTPNVAGYYQLNASVDVSNSSAMTAGQVVIYKNGSALKYGTWAQTKMPNMVVSCLVYANGTTDYFQLYFNQTGAVGYYGDSSAVYTWFDGALVRAA